MRFFALCLAVAAAAALRPAPVGTLRPQRVQRYRQLLLQQQLPPGWSTSTDPQTGQTVYCNEQSGQCQWDPPQSGQQQGGVPQQLPPGWYTSTDPQTGQTVYCNQQSGQCQWDFPHA
jgi:hypothetical protein